MATDTLCFVLRMTPPMSFKVRVDLVVACTLLLLALYDPQSHLWLPGLRIQPGLLTPLQLFSRCQLPVGSEICQIGKKSSKLETALQIQQSYLFETIITISFLVYFWLHKCMDKNQRHKGQGTHRLERAGLTGAGPTSLITLQVNSFRSTNAGWGIIHLWFNSCLMV